MNFDVQNDNNGLFSAQPAIDANGNLTFTPGTDIVGTANVTVTLHDNGGTANGGVDTSAAQMFTISVTPVNHAPSFTAGSDQTVLEDSGAATVNLPQRDADPCRSIMVRRLIRPHRFRDKSSGV